MTTKLHIPPTATPCPDWCGQPAGHGYIEVAGENGADSYGRSHSCSFGYADCGADVSGWATAPSDGAPERVVNVGIDVWVAGQGGLPTLSAEGARDLATDLLTAAAKLDAITAAGAA